jgi:hypothetical protein
MQKIIYHAGFGLDRLLMTEIAYNLWCDAYWTSEREKEYRQAIGCQCERDITARSQTPPVPQQDEILFELFHICGRIEQAWGKSFHVVCEEMRSAGSTCDLSQFVFLTIMGCCGHGVSADDEAFFPEELDPCPIEIENPLIWHADFP